MKRKSQSSLLFKTVILLSFFIYLIVACSPKNEKIEIRNISDGEMQVSFKINKNFLMLPIQDGAAEKNLEIKVGKDFKTSITVGLAETKVDYLLPIDLRDWNKGATVVININDNSLAPVWKDNLDLVNEFNLDYADKYRPVYHFTSPYGWLDNPCGTIFDDGVYKLYFQFNPYGTIWGNTVLGEAEAENLFFWEYEHQKFQPTNTNKGFSGSLIKNNKNLSDLPNAEMVYFYTTDKDPNTISLAFNTDDKDRFTEYSGNPVIKNNERNLTDPKVFWYEPTQKWIMIIASDYSFLLYSSDNLIKWNRESEFVIPGVTNSIQVNSPELFPLYVNGDANNQQWILMYTVRNCGNNDGSCSLYMTGDFNGSEFIINENSNVSKLDYGRDFAFASSWLNNKDERIIIGWMSNIVYAPQLPTVLYKNYKSIPRKLALKTNKDNELVLYSSVVNQFDSLKTRDTSIDSLKIDGKKLLENKFQECDGAFSVEFSFQSSQQKQVGVMLSNKNNENVNVLFDLEIGQLLFDRNKSGIVDFSSLFTMENIIPINKSDKYKVNIYSDKSSIEVFINDGETVLTNLVFPTESYTDLTFYNEGKALIIEDIKIREFSASIYQLSFEWMNWLDNSGDR